jgi:hypothetical protein
MKSRYARSALTRLAVLSAAWALACGQAGAQAARDPTIAPPQAATAPAASPGLATGQSLPAAAQGLSVVVREGAPYLVSDTRLYGVGQTVGGYTIERITETEVWLRRGKQVQKFQRFSGIQRRVAQP